MNGRGGLLKEDDSEIAFVLEALFAGAITLDELRGWAEHVVETLTVEDVPPYVFELLDYDGGIASINKVIGFYPVSHLSSGEVAALTGMAYARGLQPFDNAPSKAVAQRALDKNAHILARFKNSFPFLTVADS